MMKFHDFINFSIVLKPKTRIKYTRIYKKNKDKEIIGSEL